MRVRPSDRALEVLGDYLFELETADGERGVGYGQSRTLAGKAPAPEPVKGEASSAFDRHTDYVAGLWEKEKVKEWKEQGRIADDGRLRVVAGKPKPYTLEDVMRVMPHLSVFDRLAALIDLDGVVEEGFMDAHENIREVVATISREEVDRVLSSQEGKDRVADMVYEQVGVVFGTLLDKLKRPGSALTPGGSKQRCSKCGTAGHRKTTCEKTDDEAAAMKAASQNGAASESLPS